MMQIDDRRIVARASLVGWCCLLAVVTYGAVLHLPFFLDDLIQIPYLDKHSLITLWQTADELAFYRPLGFSVWKVMHFVLGHHSAFALHVLNLILHLGNALMVAWLSGRLFSPTDGQHSGRLQRGFLSATLFLVYPFAYEALAYIGPLFHHLTITLILASVISYLRLRETGQFRWGALSLALATLSPFAHENGIIAGPLIVCIEICLPSHSEPLRRRLRRAAIWWLPILIWLPIWRAAPKGFNNGELALNNPETMLQNSAYFLQGAAYPVTWLGGALYSDYGANDLATAISLSLPALIGAALIQKRAGRDRRAWLAWLWCLLAVLPAIVFLRARYVLSSPRLQMLASVGTAWLWTDVLLAIADLNGRSPARRRVRIGVAAGLCAGLVLQNYTFIRARLDLYTMGGAAFDQVTRQTVDANDSGETALYINLPTWLSHRRPTYALGHEGAPLLLGDAPIENLASINSGRPARLAAARYDAIRAEMPYYYGVRGSPPDWPQLAADASRVFITDYQPDAIHIQPAGILSPQVPDQPPVATFGAVVELLEAEATLSPGRINVKLVWQVQASPPPDVTVFVHVMDRNGQLIAQMDGDPLGGVYAFSAWAPGSIAQDVRTIEANGDGLSVWAGVYNRSTGVRLSALSPTGTSWSDNAVPIALATEPSGYSSP